MKGTGAADEEGTRAVQRRIVCALDNEPLGRRTLGAAASETPTRGQYVFRQEAVALARPGRMPPEAAVSVAETLH